MSTTRVTFDWPATRKLGGALDIAEIAKANIELDAGAGFGSFAPVVPTGPTDFTEFQDLNPGDYVIRIVVEDTQGRLGDPVDFPFTEADQSAPGQVTNITVSFT